MRRCRVDKLIIALGELSIQKVSHRISSLSWSSTKKATLSHAGCSVDILRSRWWVGRKFTVPELLQEYKALLKGITQLQCSSLGEDTLDPLADYCIDLPPQVESFLDAQIWDRLPSEVPRLSSVLTCFDESPFEFIDTCSLESVVSNLRIKLLGRLCYLWLNSLFQSGLCLHSCPLSW